MARLSRIVVVTGALALVLLPGCGSDDDEEVTTTPAAAVAPTAESMALEDRLAELSGAGVFVGGVALTGNLVAIHYDHTDPDASGMTIFVTDGLPDGNAEWFEGTATEETFSFTSTSGNATIEGTIEEFETDGTITLADGLVRNYFTRPAGDGAGIFEVTVDGAGNWTGASLDGSTLSAQQDGMYVTGAVESSEGMRYEFRHNDLTRRLGYSVVGGGADTYLTVITRQATEIQGRGGDVRGGAPSANIVALDLDQSVAPTPGVFHGRVAFTTDRHHTGTSAQGATMDLDYVDGTVMGVLTSPEGEQFAMLGADLAEAYRYDDEYSKPGEYTAFVAPRGRYVFGRSGDVRAGRQGVNIIGLDKKC